MFDCILAWEFYGKPDFMLWYHCSGCITKLYTTSLSLLSRKLSRGFTANYRQANIFMPPFTDKPKSNRQLLQNLGGIIPPHPLPRHAPDFPPMINASINCGLLLCLVFNDHQKRDSIILPASSYSWKISCPPSY